MSTASLDREPASARAVTILPIDASPRARRRAAALLTTSGFAVTAHLPTPGGLLVVICEGGDAERVHVVREAARAQPEAQILAVMPADAANASLRRVLLAGAAGIVFADDLDRALGPTIRAMLAGQLVVPPVLSRQIAPRPLSHREKEILSLVVLGLTNRQIAAKLFLAESTVKTHLSSAFRKIDARSRAEAVARIQDPESGFGPGILPLVNGVTAPAA